MRSLSSRILAALVLAQTGLGAQEPRKSPVDSEAPAAERPKSAPERPKAGADNLTFDDLKGSLGELEQKETREEKEKRDSIVQKNYDDTLKIYGDALGKRDGELKNVSRRLEVNQALVAKYQRLLAAARTNLATLRAQYINRTLALKKSMDEGKITKDAHEKLLEEDTRRFRNAEKELTDDITFYQDELQNAERSVKDLGVKKELMEFDPFGGDHPADQAKTPKPTIAQKLKATLAEVSGYRPRSVVEALK